MADPQPESQAQRARALLAAAILLVCVLMLLTAYVYRHHPDMMRDLGMLELPWITFQGIRWMESMKTYWFVVVPLFIVASILAWKGFFGRPSKGVIYAVFLFALAIPCIGYVAFERPLVELDRAMQRHQGAGGPFRTYIGVRRTRESDLLKTWGILSR